MISQIKNSLEIWRVELKKKKRRKENKKKFKNRYSKKSLHFMCKKKRKKDGFFFLNYNFRKNLGYSMLDKSIYSAENMKFQSNCKKVNLEYWLP